MSKFSDYLSRLIDESGESIAALSRSVGVERTSIHKALTDERKLPYKAVQALADHFRLSFEQRHEFFRLYGMFLQGEDVWNNRQAICELFNHLAALEFRAAPIQPQDTPPALEAGMIKGEFAVVEAIRSVLRYEVSHGEDTRIQLFLPPHSQLTDDLNALWLNGFRFHVDQLFYLPAVTGEDETPAIRLLESIIPLCLVSAGDYSPYYFYDHPGAVWINPMDYYIITPHFLFLISADQSTAYLSRSEEMVLYYSDHFRSLLAQCTLLAQPMQPPKTVLDETLDYLQNTENLLPCIAFSQPCFARYYTPELVSKYLRVPPDVPYEALVESLMGRYATLQRGGGYTTLFTEEGVKRFADTGELTEVPPQYAPPISVDDRIRILSWFRRDVADGTYRGLIARPSRLRLSDCMYVMVYRNVLWIDTLNGFAYGPYSVSIRVKESGLVGAFCDFVNALPDSGLVYSREETLRILDEGIQRLQNR